MTDPGGWQLVTALQRKELRVEAEGTVMLKHSDAGGWWGWGVHLCLFTHLKVWGGGGHLLGKPPSNPTSAGCWQLRGLIPRVGFSFVVKFHGKLKCEGLRALFLASWSPH